MKDEINVGTGLSLFLKKMGVEIYSVIDFVRNIDPSKTTIAASLPSFQIPTISLHALFGHMRFWPHLLGLLNL